MCERRRVAQAPAVRGNECCYEVEPALPCAPVLGRASCCQVANCCRVWWVVEGCWQQEIWLLGKRSTEITSLLRGAGRKKVIGLKDGG